LANILKNKVGKKEKKEQKGRKNRRKKKKRGKSKQKKICLKKRKILSQKQFYFHFLPHLIFFLSIFFSFFLFHFPY
jgi:hypothetical protein